VEAAAAASEDDTPPPPPPTGGGVGTLVRLTVLPTVDDIGIAPRDPRTPPSLGAPVEEARSPGAVAEAAATAVRGGEPPSAPAPAIAPAPELGNRRAARLYIGMCSTRVCRESRVIPRRFFWYQGMPLISSNDARAVGFSTSMRSSTARTPGLMLGG